MGNFAIEMKDLKWSRVSESDRERSGKVRSKEEPVDNTSVK